MTFPNTSRNSAETITRRYTFKAVVRPAQRASLESASALCAQIWNAALEQRETQWHQQVQRFAKGERKGLSAYDQQKQLKPLRAEFPEIKALSADTAACVLGDLDEAFKGFFRRAKLGAGAASGYPKYRASDRARTIPFRDHSKGWRILRRTRNALFIYAKGVVSSLKIQGCFPVDDCEIRTLRLFERNGSWYASISVKFPPRHEAGEIPLRVTINPLADQIAVVENTANGQRLPGLEPEFTSGNKQISLNNQGLVTPSGAASPESGADGGIPMNCGDIASGAASPESGADGGISLSQRGSWRWREEKRKAAKRAEREANRRKDFNHKWTTKLVNAASEIEVIAPDFAALIESGKGHARDHGAAVDTIARINRKALSAAAMHAVSMIEEKAKEAGIAVTVTKRTDDDLRVVKSLKRAAKTARKARKTTRKRKAA